jgi:hypothetical protein
MIIKKINQKKKKKKQTKKPGLHSFGLISYLEALREAKTGVLYQGTKQDSYIMTYCIQHI